MQAIPDTIPDASVPSSTIVPDRLRQPEIGNTGLFKFNSYDNVYFDACAHELRWPQNVHTFTKMSRDATIAAALSTIEMSVSRVKWRVEIPRNAPEQLKSKKLYLNQVMNDMDNSWFESIGEFVSFIRYGFSVHEIVPRLRRKSLGSKYDDGLVGLKKLPIRAQDSIRDWKYDDTGRELKGVIQEVYTVSTDGIMSYTETDGKEIPRGKFLLFRIGTRKDSPVGESPLSSVWQSWKFKQALQEHEGTGIAQDMRGLKILRVDPRLLSDGATEAEVEQLEMYKENLNRMERGETAGILLPNYIDSESKLRLYDLELLSVTGQKSYDVDKVITRYSNEILMALHADVLKMGMDKVGSYSLSDTKTNIMAMGIEYILKEIQDTLNKELLPYLWKMNGWDLSELDYIGFQYGDIDEPDLDGYSKAIQRAKAVSMIVPSAGNVNAVAERLGLPDRVPQDIDQDKLNELLGKPTSRSGDGLAKGTGNGTSDNPSQSDNAANNLNAESFVDVVIEGDSYTVMKEDAEEFINDGT